MKYLILKYKGSRSETIYIPSWIGESDPRSVHICVIFQGLGNGARGHRPRAPSLRSKVFTIQTDFKPANNMFIFFPVVNWLTSGLMFTHCVSESAYLPSIN